MWVTGTVAGLRAGPRFTTLKLVEYEADGSTVGAVLAVGMFATHARQVRRTLAAAGVELADGLDVTLWGPLDPNSRYRRMRLLGPHHDRRSRAGARGAGSRSSAAGGSGPRSRSPSRRCPAASAW